MVKTYCSPSSETSHDSANAGSISTVPGLKRVRPSVMLSTSGKNITVTVRTSHRRVELDSRLWNGDHQRLAAILKGERGRGQTRSRSGGGQRGGDRDSQSQLRRASHERAAGQACRVQILDEIRKSPMVVCVHSFLSMFPIHSIFGWSGYLRRGRFHTVVHPGCARAGATPAAAPSAPRRCGSSSNGSRSSTSTPDSSISTIRSI